MKKAVIILFTTLLILISINFFIQRHFTAVFEDIRPFEGRIPIYYKGIIVGKATNKEHSNDLRRTHIKITLYNKKLKLPLNTKAILKKRIQNDKEFDYIELIYPDIPSERFIEENSHIHGHSTLDIKEYLKNSTPEELDKIKNNLISSSENLSSSLEALGGLFLLLQDILEENRGNIKKSSYNLKETTKNVKNFTKKVDNITIEKQWNNTFNNVESSTKELSDFSCGINDTLSKVDLSLPNTLDNAQEISENINSISAVIKQAFCKRFGILRLLFGKP